MILTPDQRLRVFVSSTLGELAAERLAVRNAIESMRLVPVMFELGARDHPSEAVYRDYLSQSDVFVSVYWQSYGWVAPGQHMSGLEDEFHLSQGMPRLVYIKKPAPERDERLQGLIDGARRSGVVTKDIRGPGDLGDQVKQDLALLLSERFATTTRTRPTGTVTFLFADVEGSTPLLERFGDAFANLLTRFRRDSESAVAAGGGALIQTEGDGAFAVFADANRAIDTAIAAQRLYLSYPEPGPLRVRIGLHTGAGVVVDGEYVGIDVHRASRVADAAHGGQVLVSSATLEVIDPGASHNVTDLGWYSLRGLSRAERLHQVTASGLPSEFPRPRARALASLRLPRPLTATIGREMEIQTVSRLFEIGTRLVTLTGTGGVGKTRLALEVGSRVEDRFQGGVGFVDLAQVSEPGQVAETIALALGRSLDATVAGEDVIVDELRDLPAFLLILDNFEQVSAAAPILGGLLERLPLLQILVTSRTGLRLSVEREYQVTPLDLPDIDDQPEAVAGSAAVQLLLDRARAVRPDLGVTAGNVEAIVRLVRLLDGIPLAIELAAARLRLFDPADLLRRLDSALDLGTGPADLPDRQRTLKSAIDWSYQLLPRPEQLLFRRIGIFAGTWTVEAAEAVTFDDQLEDVVLSLETLAAHSLIHVDDGGDGTRLRMLGPLRDYARRLLEETGELTAMRARHAFYYRQTVEGYPHGSGAGLGSWLARTNAEWGNIRQAVEWCISESDHAGLARLMVAVWPLVWLENRLQEAETWVAALRPHIEELESRDRANAMYVVAFIGLETGDFERARQCGLLGVELARHVGDGELEGLNHLIVGGALPAFDPKIPEIEDHLAEAIRQFRARGNEMYLAYALLILGSWEAARGNSDGARAGIEETLALAPRIEVLSLEAQGLTALAFLDLLDGDLEAAARHLETGSRALETRPNREVLSYLLDGYGWLTFIRGQVIEGATALGASEALRERLGLQRWPLAAAQAAHLARKWVEALKSAEVRDAYRAGHTLAPEAALELVRHQQSRLPPH